MVELDKIHKCDHCGAIAGKKRPVGKYIVELHAFEYDGELKLLCITCYKLYRRMALKEAMEIESEESHHGLFNGLKDAYKKVFHNTVKQKY